MQVTGDELATFLARPARYVYKQDYFWTPFALVGMKQQDLHGVWKDLAMALGKTTELYPHFV